MPPTQALEPSACEGDSGISNAESNYDLALRAELSPFT